MRNLGSFETELQGKLILKDNSVEFDEVSKRIETLVSSFLVEVGKDQTGWSKLFQDPDDKRLWELSYPESEIQGGGPPFLKVRDCLKF